MFGGRGERRYVQTRISRLERGLSWAILGVLAVLGAAVYWSGQSGSPMTVPVPGPAPANAGSSQPEAAPARVPVSSSLAPPVVSRQSSDSPSPVSTSPTVVPPPATARTTTDAATASPATAVARSGEDLLARVVAPGWQAVGAPEHFTAANLYEKIDGRAEQYLAYEVQALFCQQFVGPGKATIEVFAYDMGDPLRTFGVFSAERAPEHAPVKLGRDGYLAKGSCLFWQDRWYLQVLASDQASPVQEAALAMARSLSACLPNPNPGLWGLRLLPQTGRIPRTEQYLLRNALGLEFLANTFVARYRLTESGPELTAFVSRQPTAATATKVLTSYQAYLRDYGSGVATVAVSGIKATIGDLGGTYDLVFQSGELVAGVSMAPDQAAAEQLAANLAQGLAGR